jgi:hypothetical protein
MTKTFNVVLSKVWRFSLKKNNMCELFIIIVFIIYIIFMDQSLVPTRTRIIPFNGEPLKLTMKAGKPDFSKFEGTQKEEVEAAWNQYLEDLTAMYKDAIQKKELDEFYQLIAYKKSK